MSYPDDNPKTAVGATKVPLHLVPPAASHYMALAFGDGAKKYGPYNWREHTVSASVYFGAARRHFDAWWDGEDVSRDALVHHLGHVMACCAILLDAMTVGKLNDDRPSKGAAADLQAGFSNVIASDPRVMGPVFPLKSDAQAAKEDLGLLVDAISAKVEAIIKDPFGMHSQGGVVGPVYSMRRDEHGTLSTPLGTEHAP